MNEQKSQEKEQSGLSSKQDGWEREVIEKLAFAALSEQRKVRRWGIFFKSLTFIFILVVTVNVLGSFPSDAGAEGQKHTAVVDVEGFILEGAKSNAATIIEGLRAAVKDPRTAGVILKINSPGGSPVQSDYVYQEIRRLKNEQPELPIYAVVTDLCVSGGYYIAAATDKIFVNPSSLLGSIGVIMNGFGLVPAMEKLGVERRLLVAGQHKALLDPFSPVKEGEKAHIQSMLNQVHAEFIRSVKEGRGDRLKQNPDLFSGLVWAGRQSIELGLADGEGDLRSVAREVIGAETIVSFTSEEEIFQRLAHQFGTAFGLVFAELAGARLGP
ncbi:MAG: S49 family peptidase [Methylococcales bacterium]|nr:S49 family peptidase [Methylococcales bacterium]MEE2767134.1 S49 family peptidase [Pseudomonadota bacterium]